MQTDWSDCAIWTTGIISTIARELYNEQLQQGPVFISGIYFGEQIIPPPPPKKKLYNSSRKLLPNCVL